MATDWRVYGQHTIASWLDRCDLPGFFRKTVVVGPGEAAVLLRDGQVHECVTEGKASSPGILDRARSLFRGGSDIEVLSLDTGPVDVLIFLGETTKEQVSSGESGQKVEEIAGGENSGILSAAAGVGWISNTETKTATSVTAINQTDVSRVSIVAVSADQEVIQAECHLRLRVNTDAVGTFVGLLKGKKALATWDLAALLRDQLFTRVLVPEIAKRTAKELRGNGELLSWLEGRVGAELESVLRSCGLLMESFTISWGLTEGETAAIARKRAEREEEAIEFVQSRQVAHLIREQDIEKTRIANLQEVKLAKSQSDQELQDLLLAGEIRRELLEKGQEIDEARIDAEVRQIELEVDKQESMLRLEQRRAAEDLRLDTEDREFKQKHAARLAAVELDNEEMGSMVKMQIQMATAKHEREIVERRQEQDAEFRRMQADVEDRYQQRKLKLDESLARMGMMERLVAQGLNAGVADSNVLSTMLQESTEQEYATTSDEKVKARSDAQAGASGLGTYKEAEDRERQHQAKMTGLASEMMQAAKQQPGQTVVTGTGSPATPGATAPPVVINNPSLGVAGATPAGTSCSACGKTVEEGWKACPHCGQQLAKVIDTKCGSCGQELEVDWKACPKCGEVVGKSCTGCGIKLQAGWKVCPKCERPT